MKVGGEREGGRERTVSEREKCFGDNEQNALFQFNETMRFKIPPLAILGMRLYKEFIIIFLCNAIAHVDIIKRIVLFHEIESLRQLLETQSL